MDIKKSLDELDRKILYQLDLNSRQSNKNIAKKVGSNKDTVNFRINKLHEVGIIKRYSTEINTAKLGYNNIKTYFQFQNFSEEKEKEFFDFLFTLPRIGWVVSCSGRWDALFCYWARDIFDFYNALMKIENKFSKYILHKEVIYNINWFYYNRKWLLAAPKKPLAIKYGGLPEKIKLDKKDTKILNLLAKNGKIPIIDISNKTGIPSQVVIQRKRKMEKMEIITKYSVDVDYKKIGYVFCKVFLYLQNVTETRLKELYGYCANRPNIFALTTTLGSWDLELEFEVENFEQMTGIMNDIRKRFGDIIKNYESVIITKQTMVRYLGD